MTWPPQILSALAGYLIRADEPVSADIIVVLGGGWTGCRIQHAALLAGQGFAKRILVSGPLVLYGIRESDLAIPWAVQRGFPESIFTAVPNDAHNTEEESRALLAAARQYGARHILVVTSTYHTRRAGHVYRQNAGDLDVHIIAAPDPEFTPGNWWNDRAGRRIFIFEWLNTIRWGFHMLMRRPNTRDASVA